MIKVSVILPIFNAQDSIRESVMSILSQTIGDVEAVCVDDGSTDGTPEILRALARDDARVRIVTQRNQGAGVAQQAGLTEAQGEFVAFMGADDWYCADDVLEKLYEAAKKNDVFICGGGWETHAADGTVRRRFEGEMKQLEPFVPARKIQFVDYQCHLGYTRFIFAREFLRQNGIDFPDYLRFQDPPFFVKAMAVAGEFYGVDFPVYAYRIGHKEIDWSVGNYRRLKDYLRGLAEVFGLADRFGLEVLKQRLWERCNGSYFTEIILSNVAKDSEVFPLVFDLNRLFSEWSGKPRLRCMQEIDVWLNKAVRIRRLRDCVIDLIPKFIRRIVRR